MRTHFKYILLLSSVLFISCYDNETIIIEEEDNNALRFDDELTNLMKSVTSHDASFDDFIDQSHCFSINFPYQIVIEEEIFTIQNKDDLISFTEEQNIEVVFPIQVSLHTFEVKQVESIAQFNNLKQSCNEGSLNASHIPCADFIYPLKIASYNSNSRRFDELEFNSDVEAFTFLNNLDTSSVFEIKYPANIFMFHQNHFSIETNFSMNAHFAIANNTCGIRD